MPAVAAYLMARDQPDALRKLEAKGRAMLGSSGTEAAGRQVLQAVAEIRQAALEWRAREVPGTTSPVGNTELPHPTEEAASAVSSFTPGLTSGEAADRLDLTPRQVTNLARSGRLVGRRTSGGWVIDEVSVAAELERRRAG